jgi:hypothetical protein
MLRKLAAFALFALAIVLVVAAREYSPKFQECQTEQSAENTTQEHPEGAPQFIVGRIFSLRCTARFIRRENSAITAIATLLLATITGCLAYIARIQYTTTQAQLRAYVLMESASILNVCAGGKPSARIGIKNSGQTPAYKLQATLSPIIFDRYDNANAFELIRPTKYTSSGDVIPPRGVRNFIFKNEGIVLTSESMGRIVNGTHALFVYGIFDYIDAFGRNRTTNIRLYCGGEGITQETINMLRPHREGNAAT